MTWSIPRLVQRHEVADVMAPYVKSECDERAPEWREAVARLAQRPDKPKVKRRALVQRRLRKTMAAVRRPRALKRHIVQLITTLTARDPAADMVTRGEWTSARYDKYWRRVTPEQFVLGGGSEIPCRWDERRLILRYAGLKRIYLHHLYRSVAALAPTRVLEIGCGDGLNIALMANRFPHVAFTGIEITKGGIDQCHRIASDTLPAPLADFSPEPLLSRTAHRRACIHQGDAAHLPYPDGSFDLVVTVLALAQMKHIREAALTELARVCNGWAVLIEPFRDWNDAADRRRYVDAMGYLVPAVSELERYGLMPVFAANDFPIKINFGVSVVGARKIAPALRAS
jgi:SAM-dependent methyltransferase